MISNEIKAMAMQLASENFTNALSCAESVFHSLIRTGAIAVPEEAAGMATAFAGGVGLSGNTCGALIAAEMALGSVWGCKDPYAIDLETRKEIPRKLKLRRFNNLVQDFEKEFKSAHCQHICDSNGGYGSQTCRETCMKIVPYITGRVIDYSNGGYPAVWT